MQAPSPTVGEAFAEMRKGNRLVVQSASHDFHRRFWQQYLGKTGTPPVAFRYGRGIRIDIEKMSAAEKQTFIKLDKVLNPGLYKGT